ncbi:class I SAM-dependent DNA methyltransferase [Paraliomyxa miuraensis]|uniref:class I SAM-dependent DNA methyltransferase n=1 Tax=Paraliomyxa miuraensis TaxID=376150 RepID=UPI00224D8253|nr:DNA methyltransferase [Paraliomyxa miuraensis]MCX4244765.1 hypothetical protein [Paraliomyxa miuraensis]
MAAQPTDPIESTPPFAPDSAKVEAFVSRWRASEASEMQNTQLFLAELCDLIEVPRPDPATGDAARDLYCFERPVRLAGDERRTVGRIDLYKAEHFVLEAKQGSEKGRRLGTAKRGSPGWTLAMNDAYGQARAYAGQLDPMPPFLVVVDVGYAFDLYACFDDSGIYKPYPDPPNQRFFLADLLRRPLLLGRLRALFVDPRALDPSHHQAKMTREIAESLADLARDLEESGHTPQLVARFLMQCIFAMFAEDVGLFPEGKRLFEDYLERFWIPNPSGFPGGVQQFFRVMNTGGTLLTGEQILRFNGGLFRYVEPLRLTAAQLRTLHAAARKYWADVEPAIFGTLLERALDAEERHALGAHYTPRAYVERLVRPTLEEPLRAEWLVVRAEAGKLVEAGKVDKAVDVLDAFHRRLCEVRVLDPACGSGNFLYVALDLMKQLEGEVLEQMRQLGVSNEKLNLEGVTVNPAQFLGIEKKPWAKEIAELVLWIGHLRWHHRLKGSAAPPPDPVLHDYANIECRDAVLAWDGEPVLRCGEDGRAITRWDGETMRVDPITAKSVPDERAQTPVYDYMNPRPAEWPKAEFIVGNPPFIGNKRMRLTLGDGYVEALRKAHRDVPESADYVMYWWSHAAILVRKGEARRFGFITTNSITQTFNRRIVERMTCDGKASIVFAIPDHPWVDSQSGAAVRIAMTAVAAGDYDGVSSSVLAEGDPDDGTFRVNFAVRQGRVSPDLTVGVNTSSIQPLRSNTGLACPGVQLSGQGFVLSVDEVARMPASTRSALVRTYITGRDLTKVRREQYVIDTWGWTEDKLRETHPRAFQLLADRVRPERQQNPRAKYAREWWLHAEPRSRFRAALAGIDRFVVSSRTARHRVLSFEPCTSLPETKVLIIALSEGWQLGVLSARPHLVFAEKRGGWLGVGNDSTYNHSDCFDPFPFPDATKSQKSRIRKLAESLDAHRKRQIAAHPKLTITALYNVLEKLRAGETLTDKERIVHDQGLVTVLRQIHDDLDDAVFDAYGWPHDLMDEQILERLVALNRERVAEEEQGTVRWLRPDFQAPTSQQPAAVQQPLTDGSDRAPVATVAKGKAARWPKTFFDRATAIRDLVLDGSDRDAWSAMEVARSFTRARTSDVEAILDSFAALGQLVAYGEPGRRVYARAHRTTS